VGAGDLQLADDDNPEKCSFCPRLAVGPCASCARSVCGSCCVLTDGGTRTFAICIDCDRRKGRSLAGAWRGLLLWLLGVLFVLGAVAAAVGWLATR
jgi:hypothetical protein